MRIHRITLRDYRGVRTAEVAISPTGVTIVQGPNEIGKSSLAEAVQFLFDEPDSSTKRQLKAVKRVDADVGPFVEVELTTGPYRLVYAKQWSPGAGTELRVTAPTPENRTGRDAHDRVRAILDETLDSALWGALRYEQGVSITQAALGKSRTLAAALDAAATGSALGGDEEADLWGRVESERLLHVTATGRPTAERKQLDDDVASLRATKARLEEELRALDAAAELYRTVGSELKDVTVQQQDQAATVGEQHRLADGVRQKQREVEQLELAAQKAHAAARESAAAANGRTLLVEAQAKAREQLAVLELEAERAAPGLAAAKTAQSAAQTELDEARARREDAERVGRRAIDDAEHFRTVLDCDTLSERHERAERAEQAISRATAFLDTCRVDEDVLAKIQDASLEAAEARGRASREGAAVVVEARVPLELWIEGKVARLGAGERLERAVAGDVELDIVDIARVSVAGGAAERALDDEAERAGTRLAELLAAAGISGDDPLTQAREAARHRGEAEQEQATATAALRDNLRDLTLQLIAEKISRARERIAAYLAERSAEPPLPDGLDVAKAIAEQADATLAIARGAAEQRRAALASAESASHEILAAETERTVRIEIASSALRSAEQAVADARASAGDEALEAARSRDEEVARAAAGDHTRAAEALASTDPVSTLALLENAEAVLERLRATQQQLAERLAGLRSELDVRGQAGLADRLAVAGTELARTERKQELTDRRAGAAELLHERLSVHRDAARRSYVAPFKQQLDAFARIVFGADVAVEVDHDSLEIVSRTLDGVTIPYDSLSSGAKEQLCVLARLACASLVSPAGAGTGSDGGGVPVIFDDALGYSDSGRLERLGAAFNVAGDRCQVIVLTCVPERYRHIGSATVVRLDSAPGRSGGAAPDEAA